MRNVLFIVVDDLRPNLAAHGSAFMVTPHMDALAASGVLFQRAYTEWVPWDATALRPRWAAPTVGIELYDHKGDFGADLDAAAPDVNLAGVARHEATRRALSGVLRAHFRRH